MGASFSLRLAYPIESTDRPWTTPRFLCSFDAPEGFFPSFFTVLRDGDWLFYEIKTQSLIRLSPGGAHAQITLFEEIHGHNSFNYDPETDTLGIFIIDRTLAGLRANRFLSQQADFTQNTSFVVPGISSLFTSEAFMAARVPGSIQPTTPIRYGEKTITIPSSRQISLQQPDQEEIVFTASADSDELEILSCHYYGGYFIVTILLDHLSARSESDSSYRMALYLA